MKSIFYIVLLCVLALPVRAQDGTCEGEGAWLPVGEGLDPAGPVVEFNGTLYVLSFNMDRVQRILNSWNGTVWEERAALPQNFRIMTVYNNELYAGGGFGDDRVPPDRGGVMKWDGSEWKRIVALQEGDVISGMIEYRGRLIVAGRFAEIGGVQANNIAAWDGAKWEALGDGLHHAPSYFHIGPTLLVHDDILYTGGRFSSVAGVDITSVALWDGAEWSGLENSSDWKADCLVVYKDTLYASGIGQDKSVRLAKWSGSEWINVVSYQELLHWPIGLTVYNDRLYTTTPEIDIRYPTSIKRYDGSTWQTIKGFYERAFLSSANGILYATGHLAGSCGTVLQGIARFCDDETCGSISGSVFRDANGDCIKDNNEQAIGNRIVKAEPGGFHATVNKEDGSYSILVPPGSYTVSVNQRNYWQQSCPTSGTYSVAITEPAQSIPGNNFAFVAAQDVEALEVSIAAGRARPGQEVLYSIRYENVGTLPFTGTLRMTYDPVLIYQNSVAEANRHIGNTLEWEIDNLPAGVSETITVTFTLPPDASLLGTTICSHVQATPDQHGAPLNEADRYDEECTEITGSYDPNEIVVSPRGTMPEGFISPTDTVLQYVIHFQNTGNDTAFKVVVFDKIPQELDLLTLRAGASSHRYELDITENNELRWVFRDIMLPDSNTSEPNSHGYVKYEIQVKKNLAIGTAIRNAADIYFDYNEPVRTNEVVNTIKDLATTSIGTAAPDARSDVYPNPAGDRLVISSPLLVRGTVAVYNSLGDVVFVVHHTGGERVEMNVGTLVPGVYYVIYPTSTGVAGRTLTVVR